MSNSTQKRCKQCQLEGNRGKCDRKDCIGSNSTKNDWENALITRLFDAGFVTGKDARNLVAFVKQIVSDARREVVAEIEKMINQKYPPSVFTEYTNDTNVMTMTMGRGVAESTHIRRLNPTDVAHVEFLEHILATIKEEQA